MTVGEKGMKKIQKRIAVLVIFGLILVSGIAIASSNKVVGVAPYFTLDFRFIYKPHIADYVNLISNSLAQIGIKTEVSIFEPWSWFIPIILLRNTDLSIVEFPSTPGYSDPDYTGVYDENGSINVFGYHTSMDWNKTLGTGTNEWYLDQGVLIMPPNSEERRQHYWEWEDYQMDKLLLSQPLFNSKSYVQTWDTLIGYNYSKGLIQSWGDMQWSGPHLGQVNTSEFVIGDVTWTNLNPLFQENSSSRFISDAILDPLFWLESDCSIQPHLATNLEMLNDTHARIHLREGIKWQTDPDGNFTNEYFDAEDVYFTLYSWNEISNQHYFYDWIDDMKIIDKYTIDVFIDGDPNTRENEPYVQFLNDMVINILPEHYLNQTNLPDGNPDINHPSWSIFSNNCFGTGLFHINEFKESDETILGLYNNCWWLNNTITSDSNLQWLQRFGSFTNHLQKLRIKILKTEEINFKYLSGMLDISPELDAPPTESIDHQTHRKRTHSMSFLTYNVREVRPVLGNREPCVKDPSISKGLAVRKAISYAINRVEINNIVHGGEYYITDYPIKEAMSFWCNPNIIRYDYDLEKAKYYMELAGGIQTTVINTLDFFVVFQLSFSVLVVILVFKRKQIKMKQ